jgi:hypothetical protein
VRKIRRFLFALFALLSLLGFALCVLSLVALIAAMEDSSDLILGVTAVNPFTGTRTTKEYSGAAARDELKSEMQIVALIAMAFAIAPTWWVVSASRRVRRRVLEKSRSAQGLCPGCGYDIRATKDQCPECGCAVSKSGG